ncbi:MAG: choice-of-anchor H family protein [Cognaticolwellia sp.]
MLNNKLFNKKFPAVLTASLVFLSQVSFVQTAVAKDKLSHSIGGQKNNQSLAKTVVARDQQHLTTARTMAYKGMNRADVKAARLQQVKAVAKETNWPNLVSQDSADSSIRSHHGFSIYTGFSQLIEDIDGDGYYQTFSVTFDADILSPVANEQALVYADLYLSENGGPWELYFSTDDFVITGEDSDDEFEVVTRLDSGYVPTQYDVLIDLYEVGYSDVVATYSSDDTNALYALPLESADYDPEYIEVEYYEEHGGSSSVFLLSALLLLVVRRR